MSEYFRKYIKREHYPVHPYTYANFIYNIEHKLLLKQDLEIVC